MREEDIQRDFLKTLVRANPYTQQTKYVKYMYPCSSPWKECIPTHLNSIVSAPIGHSNIIKNIPLFGRLTKNRVKHRIYFVRPLYFNVQKFVLKLTYFTCRIVVIKHPWAYFVLLSLIGFQNETMTKSENLIYRYVRSTYMYHFNIPIDLTTLVLRWWKKKKKTTPSFINKLFMILIVTKWFILGLKKFICKYILDLAVHSAQGRSSNVLHHANAYRDFSFPGHISIDWLICVPSREFFTHIKTSPPVGEVPQI